MQNAFARGARTRAGGGFARRYKERAADMWIFLSRLVSLVVSLVVLGTCCAPEHAAARRVSLDPQQKTRLQHAEKIFVSALAVTEKGLVDAASVRQAVSRRLSSIGFTIIAAPTEARDVTVKVKCEERKTWEGIKRTDAQTYRPGTPSRIWKGPACQLHYVLDDRQGPWHYEVRTAFDNAREAAHTSGEPDSGQFALRRLGQALEHSTFPLALAAEWRQAHRLASLLTAPTTDTATKLTIVSLAGHVPGDTMLRALQAILVQTDLALPATAALGHMGESSVPTLMTILSDHASSVDIQAAAAEALGEIGARSGSVQILPPLLAMMQSPDVHLRVQTELVRAVGKIPDQASVEPLQQLGLKAWTSSSTDPHMQELREAVDWSLWQINPGAHTDE